MNFTRALSISLFAAVLAACGSNKNKNNDSESTVDLTSFTGANAVASASTIDSLALEADFLTPDQGIAVLAGLSEIVKAEESKGKGTMKLQYMRKYVDTYDILVSRTEDFTEEFDRLARTAGYDFRGLFNRYRDVLSSEADGTSIEDGDAGATEVKTESPAVSDSTAAAKPSITTDSID